MSSKKGSFILTGCNGGLGKAVVADFLQSSNASSYKGQFAVRKPSTATSLQAVLATSHSATGHEIITIDLSNLSSVRKAAKEINDRVKSGKIPPIRALLLNAALQHVNGQTYTDDGLESNFAVNYLANFLLALLLLPSMDKDVDRIILISSWTHDPSHPLNGHIKDKSHYTVITDPHDLVKSKENDKASDKYNAGMRRYGTSKALMILWMYVPIKPKKRTISTHRIYIDTSSNVVFPHQKNSPTSSSSPSTPAR